MSNAGTAEFLEYVIELEKRIEILKYSFHWQDKEGRLVRRWDNAPHHGEFSRRDHIHGADGTVTENQTAFDSLTAILTIEIELENNRN